MTLDIFEDDWRACLRAHYSHVIKERDTNNETSLITVLIQTGFTEEDITAMRAEVLAELGWTPDASPVESVEAAVDESVELVDTAPVEVPVSVEAEPPVEMVEPESAAAMEITPEAIDEKDDPPAPLVQMSLF